MNNHNYPKIHYPEVYVLEGGYCHYFKVSANRCDPPAYVTMDDPNHASSRREDLDQFRKTKFGRHKSYAYGDGTLKPSLSQQAVSSSKRNTAPTTLFAAAATAARTRRAGSVSLQTLAEDPSVHHHGIGSGGGAGNSTVETEHEDTDTDLGDSPCPPPTKNAGSMMMMMNKKKPLGRLLVRAETYNPSRY
jgi:M-phase inducer tyrosine phosphatase